MTANLDLAMAIGIQILQTNLIHHIRIHHNPIRSQIRTAALNLTLTNISARMLDVSLTIEMEFALHKAILIQGQ